MGLNIKRNADGGIIIECGDEVVVVFGESGTVPTVTKPLPQSDEDESDAPVIGPRVMVYKPEFLSGLAAERIRELPTVKELRQSFVRTELKYDESGVAQINARIMPGDVINVKDFADWLNQPGGTRAGDEPFELRLWVVPNQPVR